ncbi:MAG: hypothetical protein HY905_09890 [Deltaproteobacteria bacterium]|nr:hypothetical protein [Deltaproteobacteria bacterium]
MRRWWIGHFLPVTAVSGAVVAALVGTGCPPPAEEPDSGPVVAPPLVSTQQNEELAAAKARIVPYDVAQGTTVYAIRDLLQAAERLPNPRERGEAQFLAAAATLDIVLYSDLMADDRPLAGLRDAWQADGRNGIVASVDVFLERMAGSFLPAAERNARVVADAMRRRDHVSEDVPALNGIAADDGPLSFAARVLLLDLHARLLERADAEGSAVLFSEGVALAAGLPDPSGDAFASLSAEAQAVARLLAFAGANAAAVRQAASDEPLAALIGTWIDARRLDERPLSFTIPLRLADLPGEGAALPNVTFAGRAPAARLYVSLGTSEVVVGLTDEVRVSGGSVELSRAGLGGEGEPSTTCPVSDPLPAPPRRWTCLQSALAAAGAAGGNHRILLASDGNVPLSVAAAVLRETSASGIPEVEAGGVDADGLLTAFPFAFSEDRTLVSSLATVRIAQGGFYVGKRGELTQVPRVSGAYDYAGLASTVRGREPPFVVSPADGTAWSVVLGAVSALTDLAGGAGTVVQLLSGGQ